MPSSFNKFNSFVEALALKKLNLNTDSLKIALTNTAPTSSNSVFTDLTEIASGNGYSAGGTAIGSSAASQTGGVLTLRGNAVVFTAAGGTIGPFQYAVVYSDTATNKDLIGWWDNGSPVTLNSGETFTVNSAANGNWDASNPILSLT